MLLPTDGAQVDVTQARKDQSVGGFGCRLAAMRQVLPPNRRPHGPRQPISHTPPPMCRQPPGPDGQAIAAIPLALRLPSLARTLAMVSAGIAVM
ncbi:MAG: hypothetical protein MUE50_23925, partial [Pirellulaceae bacterium]|nr:hypothetical protein [Pirellulaceae bacterium]